jgi:hypothetical protein
MVEEVEEVGVGATPTMVFRGDHKQLSKKPITNGLGHVAEPLCATTETAYSRAVAEARCSA